MRLELRYSYLCLWGHLSIRPQIKKAKYQFSKGYLLGAEDEDDILELGATIDYVRQ